MCERGLTWDERALELPGVALRNALRADPGINISISHSQNWVGVCLAPGIVGLDMEAPGRQRDWLGIARAFFTPYEKQQLALAGDDQREALFLRYWTLKESCIKAVGGGVFEGLNQLRVVAEGGVELALSSESVTLESVWSANYRDLVLALSTAAGGASSSPQFWHCTELQEFTAESCDEDLVLAQWSIEGGEGDQAASEQ